jgi:hypothetical protein
MLAVGCVVAGMANAEPAVGSVRTVTSTAQLGGLDGKTYVITVVGRQMSFVNAEQTNEVSVGWHACWRTPTHSIACGRTTAYRLEATSQQLTIASDGSSASLVLSIGNAPLHLTWTRLSAPGDVHGGVTVNDTGADVEDPTSGGPATMSGQVFGVSCHGDGIVKIDEVAYKAPPAPLPGSSRPPVLPSALRRAHHRAPKCLG